MKTQYDYHKDSTENNIALTHDGEKKSVLLPGGLLGSCKDTFIEMGQKGHLIGKALQDYKKMVGEEEAPWEGTIGEPKKERLVIDFSKKITKEERDARKNKKKKSESQDDLW